ncbi:hypothetical protein [Nocardia arthritidis]|uniref:Carotenoid biosynthesis protein n=1 Tax=Nocardia arthritidis TaxID=228602 RepID=A0A6G9YPA8_9NOCA|nr:hypothetical protein [Nocardia arthritidis]QIS14917.1 hypothetical protein F5544_35430 [Nocardia arthritidis]
MIHELLDKYFLAPPVDTVTQYPLFTVLASALLVVISLLFGIGHTLVTKSPLYFCSAVAGWTLYPFFVEPIADHFLAVWYPSNHYVAATMFDRPIPWFVVLFYAGGIPLVSVLAYEIVRHGLPARYLLGLVAFVTVIEIPIEVVAGQFNWMVYYGNHAVILREPIYCVPQNGGMFAVVAWVLAWLIPRTRGWRWVFVPFAVAAVLPVFALVATFPAYIAIADHAGPTVGWAAGILSTVLNAAVVVACVYSPTLQRLRRNTSQSRVIEPTTATVR